MLQFAVYVLDARIQYLVVGQDAARSYDYKDTLQIVARTVSSSG